MIFKKNELTLVSKIPKNLKDNIDLKFYDKYYTEGAYTDLHKNHFHLWHPDMKDPFGNDK